jgi:hypothetical protein
VDASLFPDIQPIESEIYDSEEDQRVGSLYRSSPRSSQTEERNAQAKMYRSSGFNAPLQRTASRGIARDANDEFSIVVMEE